MIKWIKKLKRIVKDYDDDKAKTLDHVNSLCHANLRRILHAENLIIQHTTISADIALTSKYPSTVVVTGRYRGADYVRVFSVNEEDFRSLISRLKDMEQSYLGKLRYMDAPLELSAVIKNELKK